jgi:hypothetical protein
MTYNLEIGQMQEKKKAKTKNILKELAIYLNVKGIQGLAEDLGQNPNKLYAWIKNGNIGDTGCILGKHPEVRKEWLETGEGEITSGPRSEKNLKVPVMNDEVLEFVLNLEKTPELRLLITDLRAKTPDEILDYIRAGRKALREGTD